MKYTDICRKLHQINSEIDLIQTEQNINPNAFKSKIMQSKLNAKLDEIETFIEYVAPTLELIDHVEQIVLGYE
jgi:hypothetical protein